MDVHLTPDQKAFARRAIESGRLHSEEDAVQEALALWEQRERERAEFLLTLDDARASMARGEGRVITKESMRQLAQDVKERGRARLCPNFRHLLIRSGTHGFARMVMPHGRRKIIARLHWQKKGSPLWMNSSRS